MIEKAEIFEFGEFRADVLRRSLERAGESVALSGKAFDVLVILLEHRGEVVDKDALISLVWPDTIVEENNITVAISGLRKALGETPASRKWIVTVPGRGYSFVGEVRSGVPGAQKSPRLIVPKVEPSDSVSLSPRILATGGLVLVLVAGIIGWVWDGSPIGRPGRSPLCLSAS